VPDHALDRGDDRVEIAPDAAADVEDARGAPVIERARERVGDVADVQIIADDATVAPDLDRLAAADEVSWRAERDAVRLY